MRMYSRFSLTSLLLCLLCVAIAQAQGQRLRSRTRRMEPNLHAPNLYADRLRMQFMLVNLPGAVEPGSFWEVNYRLYFISESEFERVMRQTFGSGNYTVNGFPDFPNKILLAEGNFREENLRTLRNRVHIVDAIAFKARVPNQMQTKFARLMTFYSVRIFDARLRTTLYRSGSWLTHPFDDHPNQPEQAIPRETVYTNFFISSEGRLFYSQWPRNNSDANW